MNIRGLWVHFKTVWFCLSGVKLLAFMFLDFVSLASELEYYLLRLESSIYV